MNLRELLSLHGVRRPEKVIEEFVLKERIAVDKLSKMFSTELSKQGLTKEGTTTDIHAVFRDKKYNPSLTFWADLVIPKASSAPHTRQYRN